MRIESKIDAVSIHTKPAMSLGLIINEIATNAIKHGFNEKEEADFSAKMKKDKESNQYELILSSTSKPFPEDIDVDNPQTLGLQPSFDSNLPKIPVFFNLKFITFIIIKK